MNATFNPYRRMMIVLCVIFMFFAAVSMACEDGGTVQETGNGFVEDVLISQSSIEADVYNILHDTCSQSPECASHQLP